MPKVWLYFIALFLPLALRVVLLDTGFVNWLWYRNYAGAYYALRALSVQPQFLSFIGGWPFPVFVATVVTHWMTSGSDAIPDQFLMLPVAYVPFSVIGDLLVSGRFHHENLYVHPLVILPVGYAYVLTWTMLIRVLDKLRLVL